MKCGRKSSLIFLVLLVASYSLWAFPGRAEEKTVTPPPTTVTMTAQTGEAELQKTISGTPSEDTSAEPSNLQRNSLEKAVEIADSGSLLVGSKYDELLFNLSEAQKDAASAERAAKAKDSEIRDLKDALVRAERETGTKVYVMIDGVLAFDEMKPLYGLGLTIGSRIGNNLMVEIGAGYMINGKDNNKLSLDNYEFRAGIGWMF